MVYSIQELLYSWDSVGIFRFVLPFLLIFAIVFGILSAIGIFGKNKGINVIIALVIGLLSVRNESYVDFYGELFSKLGIGLAVVMVLLILVGLFIAEDESKYWMWGLGAIAAIVGIVVLLQTFNNLGWAYGDYGSDMVGWIIGAVLLIGIVIAVANSSSGGKSSGSKAGKGNYVKIFNHE